MIRTSSKFDHDTFRRMDVSLAPAAGLVSGLSSPMPTSAKCKSDLVVATSGGCRPPLCSRSVERAEEWELVIPVDALCRLVVARSGVRGCSSEGLRKLEALRAMSIRFGEEDHNFDMADLVREADELGRSAAVQ
mmetsp:Transcript_57345/g.131452  ORF Transcript_57345/g.131452 Transcript_57345/m.131452 type:complete len:134 (+) Transcript_57345:284-685(+)